MKLKAEFLYLILDSCVSPHQKHWTQTQTGKRQSISQTGSSAPSNAVP